MRCVRVQERLVLYLAGELTPRENSRLIGHIERCAACAALAEDLAATQERVESAWRTDVEPPATLDARVMAAVRALPPRQPSALARLPHWILQPRYAVAGALACLLLIGLLVWRSRSAPSLELAQLGQEHTRLLEAASISEVRESDPQRLDQQLSSQVRFPVRAVSLVQEGATLQGGSRTTVDSVPMVALHYEWQGHRISIFQMDGTQRPPAPLLRMRHDPDSYYVRKTGDLAYVAWHSGKIDCVMVAQAVPMHELFHLACHACERQEQSADHAL